MEKEIASGEIGTVGKYHIYFKDGFLVVEANASVPPGESITASIKVDSDKVLDAIALAVPGKIDDLLIALLKTGLKS